MTQDEFEELARNVPFEALVNLDARFREIEQEINAALAPEPAPAP
jgi:hypothetical protein